MQRLTILALILLVPACQDRAAPPAPPASSTAAVVAPAPAPATTASPAIDELARLAKRIEACEHFSGEEAYDAGRAAELRQQVAANCPGNAEELARLRRKHANNPALTRRLSALRVDGN